MEVVKAANAKATSTRRERFGGAPHELEHTDTAYMSALHVSTPPPMSSPAEINRRVSGSPRVSITPAQESGFGQANLGSANKFNSIG